MPASASEGGERYGRVAVALHWLIALGLIAQLVFGFVLDDIAPRGTASRGAVMNLHKSVGVVLGVLVLLRLAWRLAHRPPAWPRSLTHWQRRAATWGHRALYLAMLVMPLSGYLASNFNRRGVRFFGWSWAAWGPDLPAVSGFFNGLHEVAAFALAALVIGHVAVALRHRALRDGVFERMAWTRGRR